MLNIGLTGGIGSGKSTVDRFLQAKGAFIIDFDALTHLVEEPGGRAWHGIVATFGRDILNEDDTINREKLGTIVFRDDAKLQKLNNIVHPAVFDEWKQRIDAIQREKADAIIISDIPLLIEVGWQSYVDLVILIYISPEEQIRRIISRNGYSRQEAEERLNAQMPINDKIPYADFVINNEGSLDETRAAIDEIWAKLIEREKQK